VCARAPTAPAFGAQQPADALDWLHVVTTEHADPDSRGPQTAAMPPAVALKPATIRGRERFIASFS
jgi:hypothetical protein